MTLVVGKREAEPACRALMVAVGLTPQTSPAAAAQGIGWATATAAEVTVLAEGMGAMESELATCFWALAAQVATVLSEVVASEVAAAAVEFLEEVPETEALAVVTMAEENVELEALGVGGNTEKAMVEACGAAGQTVVTEAAASQVQVGGPKAAAQVEGPKATGQVEMRPLSVANEEASAPVAASTALD